MILQKSCSGQIKKFCDYLLFLKQKLIIWSFHQVKKYLYLFPKQKSVTYCLILAETETKKILTCGNKKLIQKVFFTSCLLTVETKTESIFTCCLPVETQTESIFTCCLLVETKTESIFTCCSLVGTKTESIFTGCLLVETKTECILLAEAKSKI